MIETSEKRKPVVYQGGERTASIVPVRKIAVPMSTVVMATDTGFLWNKDQDEFQLVRAAQTGNLEAFNELVIAHQDSVYRWIAQIVRDPALAEDLTQSVFIRAYQKLSTFRFGSFRSWLFRIARNMSFDELRRHRSHPSISLDSPRDEQDGQGLLDVLQDDGPAPEEMLEKYEREGWVRRSLERLPYEHREVLSLVDMDGMDYQEAAEVIGVPIGTVKSRLARARARFRQVMLESGFAF